MSSRTTGLIFASMVTKGLLRRMGDALLALTIAMATVPAGAAPAPAGPCDCPMMHMHMRAAASHSTPSKERQARCDCSGHCVCGVASGSAAYLPHVSSAVPANAVPRQVVMSGADAWHGISIKPAIPPPISSL